MRSTRPTLPAPDRRSHHAFSHSALYQPSNKSLESGRETMVGWETERLLLNHLIRAEQTRNGASGKPGAVQILLTARP